MRRRSLRRPIVLAHVSDIHAGSAVGLCPPTLGLDDGGTYQASKLQRFYWQCWAAFWARAADVRRALKADLYVVFNGDLVEGHHHDLSHLVSKNPNAQAHVFDEAVKLPLALEPTKLWVIRGTTAHGGSEEAATERIAAGLFKNKCPVVKDEEANTYSHWHAYLHFPKTPGRDGRDFTRVDITHHPRTGQREHTRGGAAVLHAHDILLSHVKAADPAHPYPDLCLRGHYHKFNDSGGACPVRVMTAGAWMGHTGHTHKVVADSIADCGGHLVVITEEGYTVETVAFPVARGAVWHRS